MNVKKVLQNEWVKLVLVTVVTTLASSAITILINRCLPQDPREVQAAEKDALLIELAKQLTGKADETTVESVKDRVVVYLRDKLSSEYATKEEMERRNEVLAAYLQTSMTNLAAKINAVQEFAERGQDPDLRYRRLLKEVGAKSNGTFSVGSEAGWEFMCGLLQILKDDKVGKAPHVAEALAQGSIRLGVVKDENRRKMQKEMILRSVDYLESYAFMLPDWYVYKAMSLLFYDDSKFKEFVLTRAKVHPQFEKEFKETHFMKDAFFESEIWPLRGNPNAR